MGTLWLSFMFAAHTTSVAGNVLEVTSPKGLNPVDTSQYGVDISRCTTITFQMKACQDSEVWLGDGTGAGSYEVIIGGWGNTKSGFRHCSIDCSETDKTFTTYGILDCTSFRSFWLSWKDNRISLGSGNVPNINTIFNEPNPNVHDIKVLGVMGYYTSSPSLRIGDVNEARFELISGEAKYADTPLKELSTTYINCGRSCHIHMNCGMFSYNRAQGACELYDRMTSSFTLIVKAGWESWNMKYCIS